MSVACQLDEQDVLAHLRDEFVIEDPDLIYLDGNSLMNAAQTLAESCQVKHPEASFVIKYFDLIDEFIKVRCCSDELLQELHSSAVTNKASYRQRVVRACIPTFESEVLAAVGRMDEEYDVEIVEELLYQNCIDVNPSLEIHQVSIPSAGGGRAEPEPEDLFRHVYAD